MDKKQAKERVKKLRREIERYRYAYHVLDRSLIPDSALDTLKKELFDLEQRFPDLVTSDSPTQRIGGEPAKQFRRVRHEERMLSFNDAFSREDMEDWLERMGNYLGREVKPEFYLELKIDGFAIELVYEKGVLVRGSTRGDGDVGEDVTENLKTVEAIPLNLNSIAKVEVPRKLIVRGEVFLTQKEFERINKKQEEKGAKPYANPRNVAAGSIRQLNPKTTASRKLDSFAYSVVSDLGQKTHAEEHRLLRQLGFKTDNKHHRVVGSLEEVFKFRDRWERRKGSLPYQIDGIVVTVNDNRLFRDLGVVGKAPRGAIAYKFSPEEATTRVKDIKVQVGRTGTLTPVATLEPVEVGGVTIQHATLHNFDQIERLDVRAGDTVVITRAGDVIPQVTKVLKKLRTGREKKFEVPNGCPLDGSSIIHEGAIYRCSNRECGARLRESMSHFVSRAAFDIRGLGRKIVDKFIDEGLLADFADIFHLDKREIAALPGFGEKSAENIVNEIAARKEIELPRFLYSLGILHIGEETSYALSDQLTSAGSQIRKPSDLLSTLGGFSVDELTRIPDIGPKVGESIRHWFEDKSHQKLLRGLDEAGVRIKHETAIGSNKLKGQTFVITGTLEAMSRDTAEVRVRQMGGHPSGSVSKKTNYVVAGENAGSKLEKAKELGVEILTEKEFLEMLR